MDKIEHPFNSDGTPYKNWDYSKPYVISDASKFVAIETPPVWECPEHVPSAEEIEKMRKAEEKRARKTARQTQNLMQLINIKCEALGEDGQIEGFGKDEN